MYMYINSTCVHVHVPILSMNSPAVLGVSTDVVQEVGVEDLKAGQEVRLDGLQVDIVHHQRVSREHGCHTTNLGVRLRVHEYVVVVDLLAMELLPPGNQYFLRLQNPSEKHLCVVVGLRHVTRQLPALNDTLAILHVLEATVDAVYPAELVDDRVVEADPL